MKNFLIHIQKAAAMINSRTISGITTCSTAATNSATTKSKIVERIYAASDDDYNLFQ